MNLEDYIKFRENEENNLDASSICFENFYDLSIDEKLEVLRSNIDFLQKQERFERYFGCSLVWVSVMLLILSLERFVFFTDVKFNVSEFILSFCIFLLAIIVVCYVNFSSIKKQEVFVYLKDVYHLEDWDLKKSKDYREMIQVLLRYEAFLVWEKVIDSRSV